MSNGVWGVVGMHSNRAFQWLGGVRCLLWRSCAAQDSPERVVQVVGDPDLVCGMCFDSFGC